MDSACQVMLKRVSHQLHGNSLESCESPPRRSGRLPITLPASASSSLLVAGRAPSCNHPSPVRAASVSLYESRRDASRLRPATGRQRYAQTTRRLSYESQATEGFRMCCYPVSSLSAVGGGRIDPPCGNIAFTSPGGEPGARQAMPMQRSSQESIQISWKSNWSRFGTRALM
jgi:hypothetical protein